MLNRPIMARLIDAKTVNRHPSSVPPRTPDPSVKTFNQDGQTGNYTSADSDIREEKRIDRH